MNIRIFFAGAILVCTSMLFATVKPGENILYNGDFEAEQVEFPNFWTKSGNVASYNPSAGPGGIGAVICENKGDTPIRTSIRQQGLSLPAGETFKISCMIKTTDYKAKRGGLIIHNSGWFSEQGVSNLPQNTDGWQPFEKEFKLEKSNDGSYGVAFYLVDFTGRIEVAKAKLEAISDGALANSSRSEAAAESVRPRLIPWQPLLHKIPKDNPQLEFLYFGKARLDKLTAQFSIDGKQPTSLKVSKKITLDLTGCALGEHSIKATLLEDDKELFTRTFSAAIVNPPKLSAAKNKKLNNFVTPLASATIGSKSMFTFEAPKDGWIFIAAFQPQPSPNLKITLDGTDMVIDDATPRHEAFRLVKAGTHKIEAEGAISDSRVVVRSIIEIFNYPLCANSRVPQNGSYGWDFHKKYVFPAVTTVNGGGCPKEHIPELHKMGLLWLANLGTSHPKSFDDIYNRLLTIDKLDPNVYDGVTCDEQFFGHPSLAFYTSALWKYPNPNDRLIYTWIVGRPSMNGAHHDFMSASLNVSKSRGRLIYEAYCHSQKDEKTAKAYIENRIKDTLRSFNEYYPNATQSTGILLGNFNQIPVISLDTEPEVDYKYYLDMQLNLLANDELFDGLATTGYWGSYYDDEELYRWSFKLLRHYCVEGNREMLSDNPNYKYKYNPGHLKNCDFIRGGEGWTAAPAAKDSIKFTKFANFGMKMERRWGCAQGTGDTLCLFTRDASKPNTLSQKMTGLIPGRTYSLQFCSADYDDMLANKTAPKKIQLKAILGNGAELIPAKSYVYIDKAPDTDKHKGKSARINFHHVRFKATAAETSLTFTDEDAKPGNKIAFNYIMLKPYFED